MKSVFYIGILLFLIMPGYFRPFLVSYLGGYGYPIVTLLSLVYFLPSAFRALKAIDFIFLIFYFVFAILSVPTSEMAILFLFSSTFIIFRSRALLMPRYNLFLHYSIIIFILGLSFQLILQYLGLYKVDYGDLDITSRFHTSAGDSNFSGFLISFFLFIVLSVRDSKITVSMSLFIISAILGVLLTESRGATFFLVPSIMRLFRMANAWIYIISLACLIFLFSMNYFVHVFDRWSIGEITSTEELSSGRLSRIEEFIYDSYRLTWFGSDRYIIPHHFDPVPAIYAPHNWYISVLLNFGYIGLILFVVGFINIKDLFSRLDFLSKLFVMIFVFISLMTESYFMNLYVVYLFVLIYSLANNEEKGSYHS